RVDRRPQIDLADRSASVRGGHEQRVYVHGHACEPHAPQDLFVFLGRATRVPRLREQPRGDRRIDLSRPLRQDDRTIPLALRRSHTAGHRIEFVVPRPHPFDSVAALYSVYSVAAYSVADPVLFNRARDANRRLRVLAAAAGVDVDGDDELGVANAALAPAHGAVARRPG